VGTVNIPTADCWRCQHGSEILPEEISTRSTYHHGDLRNALVDEAVAAAREHGPSAVVLRDIARRVGVSHNAGYRHFASRDDLLAAVAERGLAELADRMQAALRETGTAPAEAAPVVALRRLRAIGRSYIRFAVSEPGLFRTIWASPANPAARSTGQAIFPDRPGPYQLLNRVLDELVVAGALPEDRRPYSETAAWSAVHGLATLLIDGPLKDLPPDEIERATDRLCDIVEAGL
jgi:AcrR family transcriptional regulator